MSRSRPNFSSLPFFFVCWRCLHRLNGRSLMADCPENPALIMPSTPWLPGRSRSLFTPALQPHKAIVHGPSPVSSAPSDIDCIYCPHVPIHSPFPFAFFIGVFDSPRLSALRIGVVVRRSCGRSVLVHTLRMPHILAHVSPFSLLEYQSLRASHPDDHVCTSHAYGHRTTR